MPAWLGIEGQPYGLAGAPPSDPLNGGTVRGGLAEEDLRPSREHSGHCGGSREGPQTGPANCRGYWRVGMDWGN
jgi:hypothetical protein